MCIPSLVAWTTLFAGFHAVLVAGKGFLITVLVVSLLTAVVICLDHLIRADPLDFREAHTPPDRYEFGRAQLQDELAGKREELRRLRLRAQPALNDRRSMYREDTAEVIAQYGRESRHYRRVHNSLQSLIMVGSTAMTTIAALNVPDWSWQNLTVVGLGFSVTLASTFTGYFKYRERSYALRQTADAIEEELNAVMLGIGEYSRFTEQQAAEALAKFTQRVERLRNEQRRREQQLDQPAEQAPPSPPQPSA